MKKGLIVEQKRNKTLLMTSEGSFYKSKKINGEIGEETTFEPVEQNIFPMITQWFHSLAHAKPVFAAIIAFLFILPFYSWLGEEDVHAYMNIDINPSVELSLNEDYEVIDLHGLNQDGNTIIKQLDDWKGEPVKEVSLNILSLSDELGFIQEGHQVLLGISYVNEHVNQDLLQSVSQEMKTSSKPIEVAAFEVPKELLEKAHEQKVSMNFVYATELIEKKEQLKEIEKDSAKQSSNNKIEEQNMKVIEKIC
ncbi:anti-sigma factor domain-containing protein [Piscibacillus salipiscarius]|uniref:anti-sigma factor domain-containing protein n=1 Tax=Piscibacillus salipiscarius TaxID=299480 RepID=UPI0006D1200F|nr:anti-sigma factor domain-containing protein [Piscibacillus salipiscarius]